MPTDVADATPPESAPACPTSLPYSPATEAVVPFFSQTTSCTSSEGTAQSLADTADASLSESAPACPASPPVSSPVCVPEAPPDSTAAKSAVAPVSETAPSSPHEPAVSDTVSAPFSPMSNCVTNPLPAAAVPGMDCALEQGGDAAETDIPAADCHTAVPTDTSSPGAASTQPASAPDMVGGHKPERQGGGVAEADAPAAVPSGQPDTSPLGSAHVQPDSAQQASQDGGGACSQATGICDQVIPAPAGGTDSRKAPACLPTQPDLCPFSSLSPSVGADPSAEENPSYSFVATASQPDCKVSGVVDRVTAGYEAEDSCQSANYPGLTQDAGSFSVNSPNKDNGAAGCASVSAQLEAETAADEAPLQPGQKLPVPPPAALVLNAAVSAAMSASASDQGDSSHDAAASPAGSGSQPPPPSSRRTVPMLEMSSVDYSFVGKKKRRPKKMAKVSFMAHFYMAVKTF